MIGYIKGAYAGRFEGGVIIENNDIGFEVRVPDNDQVYLLSEGEFVKLNTIMMVKEDDISLCGFSDKDALDLFKKLIQVSGVGAKGALGILSSMPLIELKKAIIFQDVSGLSKSKGIGKKTAERICLELKDKLGDPSIITGSEIDLSVLAPIEGPKNEAIDALISLGYSKAEASLALSKVEANSVEEYIKLALKNL